MTIRCEALSCSGPAIALGISPSPDLHIGHLAESLEFQIAVVPANSQNDSASEKQSIDNLQGDVHVHVGSEA
jgi:hypothetical protein